MGKVKSTKNFAYKSYLGCPQDNELDVPILAYTES